MRRVICFFTGHRYKADRWKPTRLACKRCGHMHFVAARQNQINWDDIFGK